MLAKTISNMSDTKEKRADYSPPSQGSVSTPAEVDWSEKEELKARRKCVSLTMSQSSEVLTQVNKHS